MVLYHTIQSSIVPKTLPETQNFKFEFQTNKIAWSKRREGEGLPAAERERERESANAWDKDTPDIFRDISPGMTAAREREREREREKEI